jgi:MFS family permease
LIPFVSATMLANGIRGIGWAGLNTGGYSLLALTAPPERRGEASGYYTGIQSSAGILFPAVALWLIDAPLGGFPLVFVVAAALAIPGAGTAWVLKRGAPRKAHSSHLDSSTSGWLQALTLLEREVLLASTLHFCLYLSLPAVMGFLVLYARELQIANIGWYYVVSGITSVLARPLLGRVSDNIGRGSSLAAGFVLEVTALSLLAASSTLAGLLIAAALHVAGAAIGVSTTLALAMERAAPERRGRAMATFSIAYPLSFGVGGLLSGSVVEIAGYAWMFLIMAGLAAIGLLLTLANWSNLK